MTKRVQRLLVGEATARAVHEHLRSDDPQAARRALLAEIENCTCVEYCDEHPPTACSLSGIPHVHPDDGSGTFGPCPVHPDRPGDH